PLTLLRSQRLLRGTGLVDAPLTTYHDRVRETVVARLEPNVRQAIHRRLAEQLAGDDQADPEVVAWHHDGAGNAERAADGYVVAAQRAATALAFEHAARLYRRALELGRQHDCAGRPLRLCLADALANAGRGLDAAREYEAAARQAPADQARGLRG